jgi:anthranilate phosphoribosyltransferase
VNKQAAARSNEWFNGLLAGLATGRLLTLTDARRSFTLLFTGGIPFAKAKSFLLLLSLKGETAEELLGCVQALQSLERSVTPKISGVMDTCGTGGDGRQTLNISTLVALVIAGAGVKVAKHGNRAISSKSGSSDLMEAFGVRLDASRKKMIRATQSSGLGYFHAPYHHPVFSKMQPLRRSLRRPTILNLLGPLVNPLRLDYQLVGVAQKRLLPLYAKVLAKLGRKNALVCHSDDGMDEISTSVPTAAAWVTPDRVRMTTIRPGAWGLKAAKVQDLTVDSIQQSKRRAQKILTGRENGPARDTIVLNAAYGLLICQKVSTVREGIALAQKSIDSGQAINALQQLRRFTNPAHTGCGRKTTHPVCTKVR